MSAESVPFNKPRYNASQPNARKLTEAEAFQTQFQGTPPQNQAPIDAIEIEDSDDDDFYDAQFEVSSPESPTAIGSSDSDTGEEDQLESSPEEENPGPSTSTQPRRNIPQKQETRAAPRQTTLTASLTSSVNRPRPQEAESSESTSKKRKLMIRKPAAKWTDEEKQALEAGLLRYKGPHWARIKIKYADILQSRTNINLKDKARNEIKAMERQGKEPQEGTPYYFVNNPDPDVQLSGVEDNDSDEEDL